MHHKYLAFDLEITKEIPESGDWRASSPLGISCAAALASDSGRLFMWSGRTDTGAYSPQMTRDEVRTMIEHLCAQVSNGYTLLTWNGLGFDFPVLAEESELDKRCRQLATHHVDMMFHLFCVKGYRLGLNTAAKGMGLPGKTAGMSGADVPKLWANGEFQQVLGYLTQDVRTTADLAHACSERGALSWLSRRGNLMDLDLPGGWLTVEDATRLPEPDTSWMADPPSRSDFTDWLYSAASGA